jgi:hypothetical protein
VGCGLQAPQTDTHYTLISSTHGWRVVRGHTASGDTALEWRCPACWKSYKASGKRPSSSVPPARESGPPPSGILAAAEAGRLFDRARVVLAERKKDKT